MRFMGDAAPQLSSSVKPEDDNWGADRSCPKNKTARFSPGRLFFLKVAQGLIHPLRQLRDRLVGERLLLRRIQALLDERLGRRQGHVHGGVAHLC